MVQSVSLFSLLVIQLGKVNQCPVIDEFVKCRIHHVLSFKR